MVIVAATAIALLEAQGVDMYTLAEIPESLDPDRVLRYFRALWLADQPRSRNGSP